MHLHRKIFRFNKTSENVRITFCQKFVALFHLKFFTSMFMLRMFHRFVLKTFMHTLFSYPRIRNDCFFLTTHKYLNLLPHLTSNAHKKLCKFAGPVLFLNLTINCNHHLFRFVSNRRFKNIHPVWRSTDFVRLRDVAARTRCIRRFVKLYLWYTEISP